MQLRANPCLPWPFDRYEANLPHLPPERIPTIRRLANAWAARTGVGVAVGAPPFTSGATYTLRPDRLPPDLRGIYFALLANLTAAP